MTSFSELLSQLISTAGGIDLTVNGAAKQIVGMAAFRTVNTGDSGYIKLMFSDGSFMLVVPDSEQLFYADAIMGQADGIPDNAIGVTEKINFNGKDYKLENKDDFQYVLQLFKGGPDQIEGEVTFSDYIPVDGSSEILSLGWILRDGRRADINCKEIDIANVEITAT